MTIPRLVPALVLLAAATASAAVRPSVYMAFGDSITAGFDDTVGDYTPGYEGYLLPMLQGIDPAAQILNAGKQGEQTGQGLSRLNAYLNEQQPQFALVMEGINDIEHGAPAEAVAFNLEQMAQMCQVHGAIPILATVTPDFTNPSILGTIGSCHDLVVAYVGDQSVVTLADTYAATIGHPEDFGGQHPNQTGYQALAQVFFDAIQRHGTTGPPPFEGGDVDHSGLVDGWDLVRVALAFGAVSSDPRYDAAADFNFDYVVDGTDLAMLAANFGKRL